MNRKSARERMPRALVSNVFWGAVPSGWAWAAPYVVVAVTGAHGAAGGDQQDAWLTLLSALILGGMCVGALIFGSVDPLLNRRLTAFAMQLGAAVLWLVQWWLGTSPGPAHMVAGVLLGICSYSPWMVINATESAMSADSRRWLPRFLGWVSAVAMVVMGLWRSLFIESHGRWGLGGAYLVAALTTALMALMILKLPKEPPRTGPRATLGQCFTNMRVTATSPVGIALMAVSALNSGILGGWDLFVSGELHARGGELPVTLVSVAFVVGAVVAYRAGSYAGTDDDRVRRVVTYGFLGSVIGLSVALVGALLLPDAWIVTLLVTAALESGTAVVTALILTLNSRNQNATYWAQVVAFIIAIKFAAAFGFAHAARSVVEPTFGWKGVVTLSLISGTLGLLALGWVRRVSSRSKHAGPGTWLTRRLARFSRWSRTVGGHRFNLRRPDINNPRQLEHVLIRIGRYDSCEMTLRTLERPSGKRADRAALEWLLLRAATERWFAMLAYLRHIARRNLVRAGLQSALREQRNLAPAHAKWWYDVAARLSLAFDRVEDKDVRARLWDLLLALQALAHGTQLLDEELFQARMSYSDATAEELLASLDGLLIDVPTVGVFQSDAATDEPEQVAAIADELLGPDAVGRAWVARYTRVLRAAVASGFRDFEHLASLLELEPLAPGGDGERTAHVSLDTLLALELQAGAEPATPTHRRSRVETATYFRLNRFGTVEEVDPPTEPIPVQGG